MKIRRRSGILAHAMQKLTPGEISRVVAKIRRRYEEYITRFFKPRSLRLAFEERYMQALRRRVDISSFLMAEIGAIEELIRREEERLSGQAPPAEPRESFSEKVDRVIEEQRERVRSYPEVHFHADASEEVRHLLGALSRLEREYWQPLMQILQDTPYARSSLTTINLENQMRYLGSLGSEGVSSGLSRYLYHLNRFPRNYVAIDREEKEYILGSAFFLHDLNDILVRVRENYPQLPKESRRRLEEIQGYVEGVIRDFRVKEFRRAR